MPDTYLNPLAAPGFIVTGSRDPSSRNPAFYRYDDNNLGVNKLVAMGQGWRDMIGNAAPKTSGLGAPTLDTITGNIRGLRYTAGDDLDDQYHMQHDYAVGTDLYVHNHWTHNGTNITGAFKVDAYLTYAKGHQQASFHTQVCVPMYIASLTISNTPALYHRIEESQASASGGLIASAVNVSITSGTPTLTSASALFSAGDVNRTVRIVGAGAAGANHDTTISAYTSTTQVTLAANASTTVTAQPNFRYRVLDTDNIEVDGVILVHYDAHTIPTITGGSGEPFILYVDMHYQTDRFATLNKAPNFYA